MQHKRLQGLCTKIVNDGVVVVLVVVVVVIVIVDL